MRKSDQQVRRGFNFHNKGNMTRKLWIPVGPTVVGLKPDIYGCNVSSKLSIAHPSQAFPLKTANKLRKGYSRRSRSLSSCSEGNVTKPNDISPSEVQLSVDQKIDASSSTPESDCALQYGGMSESANSDTKVDAPLSTSPKSANDSSDMSSKIVSKLWDTIAYCLEYLKRRGFDTSVVNCAQQALASQTIDNSFHILYRRLRKRMVEWSADVPKDVVEISKLFVDAFETLIRKE
jgi:hypothetical protein